MEIKTIGIIGSGQMGSGIAQVSAMNGLDVILNDIKEEFVEKGYKNIEKILSRNVEKGKISDENKESALKRIKTSVDLMDMSKVDCVIEAATEKEDLKFQIFHHLDKICDSEVILASNTSSIPIGKIAFQTKRADRVIGMHFFNPVPAMKLVEIIRGIATSEKTLKIIWDLSIKLEKTPAEASDYPGFISNRILMPMINEAIFCLYTGVGSREDIDTVMKFGMNHPMGPLALADLIGLDTCLAVLETLYNGFCDSKYRPCPLLQKYVNAGWLGRKSGRGFFEYD